MRAGDSAGVMRATRRFWATAGVSISLVGLGAVLSELSLVLGGVAVGSWLLAHQVAFVTKTNAVLDETTVTQSLTPRRALESQPVRIRASLSLPDDSAPLRRVDLDVPIAAETTGETTLDIDGDNTSLAVACSVSVAGRYTVGEPTLTFRDSHGLFETSVTDGNTESFRVEPNAPRDARVGSGGDQISVGYGEHEANRGSGGLDPGELRKYLPGDPRNRIDWKATARRGEPYIREFESSTDRETIIFLDHRASTAAGQAGRTRFDYLREVALWLLDRARDMDDPVGLVSVGDEGVTSRIQPGAGIEQYRRIETALYDLEPTEAPTGRTPTRQAEATRQTAARLATDESPFGRTLEPYVGNAETYVERVESDPLFTAVKTTLSRVSGDPWVLLLTDDTNRAEVYETGKLVRRLGGYTSAFIAPGSLYQGRGLPDAETTYREYRDFEEFRRQLGGLERVDAYEVTPGEAVQSVLQQRQGARR